MFSFRGIFLSFIGVMSIFQVAKSSGETQVTVGYWAPNTKCVDKPSPPINNATYVLNKCYGGTMYTCDLTLGGGVTLLRFGDENCLSKYPTTGGLPANYCLSPVYGYSGYDTYLWCHK